MASPLNVFKTVTAEATTIDDTVYTAPNGVTSIILMAQAANITANTADVTFLHNSANNTAQTELVKDYSIPGNDAAGLITGKLVIEPGNSVSISASANNSIKLTLSVLETLNA
jgi:hypothetical protein